MKDHVFNYIKKEYGISPEYPWRRDPESAVFRHDDNKKWFALVMEVKREKLGLYGEGYVNAVNLKVNDMFFRDMLISQEGITPAYHMNKQHWITVVLDGTVAKEQLEDLIDISFTATASSKKKKSARGPKEWLVPANPKYYDIVHAFDEEEEINWKQGAGIKTGDTIFMYVASPVSAIMYKCSVGETDIPCDYHDRELTVKKLMRIKLIKRYDLSEFPFELLKNEYGIFAIRGPRGIPNSLSEVL